MEPKTIGSFIAALRKANGMTQKDLAERLNVSDKTVSRWERNDGAPDLSAIPVLAEIFGVTCDELLRGERRSPEERTETESEGASPKGQKQRQRLLKSTLSQYQTRTCIAIGISVVGLIVAFLCNLAFLKAVLGFLCAAIFFTVSVVCQIIFINRSLFSVEDAGLEEAVLWEFRRNVIVLAEKSFGVTAGLMGFTFPLVLMDAYLGLRAEDFVLYGSLFAAVFLLLYAVICYFLNASFLKRGICTLSEKEAAAYAHNHRLKRVCAMVLIAMLAVTGLAHQLATAIYGPWSIMDGIVFHDYESFIAYMEQEIPNETNPDFIGEEHYFDNFGNEITKEAALHRTLEDKNGRIVCEYTDLNETVESIRYTPGDGTVLPITVSTYDDLEKAREQAAVRTVLFGALYAVETVAVVLVYCKKRAK